ncbi:uncharacterized protein H6S33_001279 [Morchella sextelata]|uniref:uncharacterized protein n=1 Tax=Morchella sextelata TaxID=1174677 RepID=UPI001D040443|nr:uncharacterized protein H6S33_001279 [Morchella sextelata]KAH0609051.1 hypothetical protein H6S33_001279 [Morchella sextelata]
MSLLPTPNPHLLPKTLYIYSDVPPTLTRPPSPLPTLQDLEQAVNDSIGDIDHNTDEMEAFLTRPQPYSVEEKGRAAVLLNTAEKEVEVVNTHRGVCALLRGSGVDEGRLAVLEQRLEDAASDSAEVAWELLALVKE